MTADRGEGITVSDPCTTPDAGVLQPTPNVSRDELPAEVLSYLAVLALLPEWEREGQLAVLAAQTRRLDPRGRADIEPRGGRAITYPPAPPAHPAYGDPRLADPRELYFLGSDAMRRLSREGRVDELRATVAALPAELVTAVVDEDEQHAREVHARAVARQQEEAATAASIEAREAEQKAQSMLLWADWLEEHREEIAALRATSAPSDLSQGAVRWLAVGGWSPPNTLGQGETIEEAHRAAIEAQLEMVESAEAAEGYFGAELANDLGEVARVPTAYLKLQGPAALVEALAVYLARTAL